jgi:hypothetical protein
MNGVPAFRLLSYRVVNEGGTAALVLFTGNARKVMGDRYIVTGPGRADYQ